MGELQAARSHGPDGLCGRQSQFRLWPPWLAQDHGFLARTLMPIDDGKTTVGLKYPSHDARQPRLVRHAVKRIRHEHEIGRPRNQMRDVEGIGRKICAVRQAAFLEAMPRDVQQTRVDIDCRDLARDLGDLKREPAVAGTEVDHVHAGLKPNGGKHTGRIAPQRFPPAGGRHLGALEESGRMVCHGVCLSCLRCCGFATCSLSGISRGTRDKPPTRREIVRLAHQRRSV